MSELLMTGLTDPGRVRTENEDHIAAQPEIGLAVLADGMGGHQAGEVASGMAVDIITHHFRDFFARARSPEAPASASPVVAVSEAIQIANQAIYQAAHTRSDYTGMGSTIVVVVFFGNRLCIGHVGDSRAYRFRGNRLAQLTQDHSVIQELVNRGLFTPEEARLSVGKNLVTRALGVEPTIIADVLEQNLEEADIYLLCSDGLNDVLSDEEISAILKEEAHDLPRATRRMVDFANERGGPDNISVILARTGSSFSRGHGAARPASETMEQI